MEHSAIYLKRNFLFAFVGCCLQFFECRAQELTWGLSVSPGFGKSHTTISVGYDPNYFVDLKIQKPNQFNFAGELFLRKSLKKNWFLQTALGYTTFAYVEKFQYDQTRSAANIISNKYDFGLLSLPVRVGKSIAIGKLNGGLFVGVNANFAVRAKWTYTSIYRVTVFEQIKKINRFNPGGEIGAQISYPLNEKLTFGFSPCYTVLFGTYDPNENRVHKFAFALTTAFKLR